MTLTRRLSHSLCSPGHPQNDGNMRVSAPVKIWIQRVGRKTPLLESWWLAIYAHVSFVGGRLYRYWRGFRSLKRRVIGVVCTQLGLMVHQQPLPAASLQSLRLDQRRFSQDTYFTICEKFYSINSSWVGTEKVIVLLPNTCDDLHIFLPFYCVSKP